MTYILIFLILCQIYLSSISIMSDHPICALKINILNGCVLNN